jgi:hypothetical protein
VNQQMRLSIDWYSVTGASGFRDMAGRALVYSGRRLLSAKRKRAMRIAEPHGTLKGRAVAKNCGKMRAGRDYFPERSGIMGRGNGRLFDRNSIRF